MCERERYKESGEGQRGEGGERVGSSCNFSND
jgi:hypothetical protein